MPACCPLVVSQGPLLGWLRTPVERPTFLWAQGPPVPGELGHGKMAFGSSRNHLSGTKCVATTAQPLMPMADIANQLGGFLT